MSYGDPNPPAWMTNANLAGPLAPQPIPLPRHLAENYDRFANREDFVLPRSDPVNVYVDEVAKVVRSSGGADVFQGYGDAHFTHVRDEGFHATTNIPGFGYEEGLGGKKHGQADGLSHHDYVSEMIIAEAGRSAMKKMQTAEQAQIDVLRKLLG